jgi:hypothetical protein
LLLEHFFAQGQHARRDELAVEIFARLLLTPGVSDVPPAWKIGKTALSGLSCAAIEKTAEAMVEDGWSPPPG